MTAWISRTALLALAMLVGGTSCKNGQPQEDNFEIQGAYQRGNIALGEGKLEVAEAEFRRVLTMDSSHTGALHKLARTLLERARRAKGNRGPMLEEATHLLQKSVTLDPQSKVNWNDLARACREAGNLDDSAGAYQKLIALDKDDLDSQVALAGVKEEKGEPAQAEQLLKAAIASHPQSGVLELALGRMLLRQKREEEAKAALAAVTPDSKVYSTASLKPDEVFYEAQDELGRMAARTGKYDEARRIYGDLVKMNPNDFMAWEVLAAIDEQDKKLPDAEQKYRHSLDIDRMHMSAWRGLGRTLLAQGKRDDAIFAFRKADGFVVNSPDQAIEFADELIALGDRGWARSMLGRARILAAEDPKLLAAVESKLKQLGSGAPTDGGSGAVPGGDG